MSELFAGLDVSVDETSICVVDIAGTVLMECTAVTEPEAIAKALAPFARVLRRSATRPARFRRGCTPD